VLALFRKAPKSTARAGIVLADGSFALALVSKGGSKPSIDHCAVHSLTLEPTAAVRSALDKLGASRAPTCAVIDGEDYQVVQVEAPDVLPSEMRAAIRWRLRDAIAFNVDEAAVDVFETPEPVRRTSNKMLFAVAARDSAIQRVSGVLKSAAKGFDAIDIPELCLRNISAFLPQDQKGVAMLAINGRFAQLVITRQGVMYLTRRIDVSRGFNPHKGSNADEVDAGALALELQRSLDYYEKHYD
jgi:MSHA biogenesis protein MshI